MLQHRFYRNAPNEDATAKHRGLLKAVDYVKLTALAVINSVSSPLTLSAGALGLQASSGSQAGSMSSAHYSKLDGISTASPVSSTNSSVTWNRTTLPNGKRLYNGHYKGVSLSAAADQLVVNNGTLPDSLTMGGVIIMAGVVCPNSQQINVQIRGESNGLISAGNSYQVAAATTDGANLSAKNATADFTFLMFEI